MHILNLNSPIIIILPKLIYVSIFLFICGPSITGGKPKKLRIYLLKNYVCVLTCLNFSHLQSTLHLMQYTYQDVLFTA